MTIKEAVIEVCHKIFLPPYEKKMRRRLKNHDFTFLASNCTAGIIYHRLGMKFLSPTINMFIWQDDFLKFVLDLPHYLGCELQFIETEEPYPVAMLDDIKLYFNHYKTAEEAREKWEDRKKRMHMDNLYILMCDRDGITEDDMRKLEQVDCKNKVVLTAKPHPDIDFAFQLPEYANEDYVGYYLGKNAITDKTVVEKHFDFVKWLNGASPKDCHL